MLRKEIGIRGLWGDCLWTIKNGILTIDRGVGSSINSLSDCPWRGYASEISIVWFSGAVKLPENASVREMFAGCTNLKHADLDLFDTSNVTDMSSMFENCEGLVSVNCKGMNTEKVVFMNRMFAGCRSLKDIDVSGFDVSSVREMNGMFERCETLNRINVENWKIKSLKTSAGMFMNCSNLKEFKFFGNVDPLVNESSFDTNDYFEINASKLVDISWMFAGCTSLKLVDFCDVDFRSLRNINRLFDNCFYLKEVNFHGTEMQTLETADSAFDGCRNLKCIDISGTGKVESTLAINVLESCVGIASVHTKGTYDFFRKEDGWEIADDGIYFRPGVVFDITYYPNGGSGVSVKDSIMAKSSTAVKDNMFPPLGEYIFKEWNTRKDGKGKSYYPGDKLTLVHYEMHLYAIWGSQPEIRNYEIKNTIVYGEKIVLLNKEIFENNGNIESLTMEISRDGTKNWKTIGNDEVLPVSKSGHFVRLCAKNSMGVGYSQTKQIRIRKADFDISSLKWKVSGNLIYDGTEKKVELTNIPKNLQVRYEGNIGVDAGSYLTNVFFIYDEANYNPPPVIAGLKWQIQKGKLDLSEARWSQLSEKDCIYDGREKTVILEGIPDGISPEYKGNRAVNAGTYIATVTLKYDEKNYYRPVDIPPFRWEIKQAKLNTSNIKWDYSEPKKYNDKIQNVELINVPKGVKVDYAGNRAIRVGEYTAYAVFSVEDEMNYQLPERMTCNWKIEKGLLDLSGVKWTYREPFNYDGKEKSVFLTGLPEKVYARYECNVNKDPGVYMARAVLEYDSDNYLEPEVPECEWRINKIKISTKDLKWDYKGPINYDGRKHEILLTGPVENMTIVYSGNKAENAGQYVASAEVVVDKDKFEVEKIQDLKWMIRKVSPDMSDVVWDYSEPYIYDQMPKSVILHNVPEGLKVKYDNNRKEKAGEYIATAYFTPELPDNIETPEPMQVKWKIEKAECDITDIEWMYITDNVYDGTEKSVELSEIPRGYKAIYKNNTAIDSGQYAAQAKLIPLNSEDYKPVNIEPFLWTVEKADYDMTKVHWYGDLDVAYDGTIKKVELKNIPEGLIVHYSNNTASKTGKHLAVAEFKNENSNYHTPQNYSLEWSIRKAELDLNAIRWNYKEPFEYTGEICRIELENLPSNVSVRYNMNEAINSGNYIAEAVLIPDEKNSYNIPERFRCKWEIRKKEFDISQIRWNYTQPFIFNRNPFTVKLEGLPEGLNAKYEGNVQLDAGNYTARAEFYTEDRHNYVIPDMMTCDWRINKADFDMSRVTWTNFDNFVYDGVQKSIRLQNVPSQLRVIYQDNIAVNAGNYRAKAGFSLIGEENYNIPEPLECDWKIEKAEIDMNDCAWTESKVRHDSGAPYHVFVSNIPESVSVKYEGNIQELPGIYMVRAEFYAYDNLNYKNPSPMDLRWVIDKLKFDMSQVQWDYIRDSYTYDGKEKEVQLMGLPEGLKVKYSDNRGVNSGKYLARADFTPDNPDEYMAPAPMECEWSIAKKNIDMHDVRWDTGKVFTYDGSEKKIELINLPEEVEPIYENNTAVNAGEYMATVTFRVDTKNYEIPEFVECPWKIYKSTPDLSGVRWSTERVFTYDGTEKSVILEGVPFGMKIEYSGNSYTDVGEYTATADIIPESAENYYRPMVQSCKWEIKKAKYDLSDTYWQEQTVFTYDGTEKIVQLKNYPESLKPHYYENKKKNAGSYSASVAFEYDIKNYHRPEISGVLWTIEKGKFDLKDVKWSSDDDFVYDGKEKKIVLEGLPPGLGVEYYGNYAKDAGEYTAQAVLLYDSFNYEQPYVDAHIWSIKKAVLDLEDLEWDYSEPFVYDGTEKRVELKGIVPGRGLLERIELNEPPVMHQMLPRGTTVQYENNRAVNAGEYRAIARIIPPDADNYEQPEVLELKWTIGKTEFDTSSLIWNYSIPFVYDGKEKSVELVEIPEGIKEVRYTDNKALETGSFNACASFIMEENSNYLPPENMTLNWKISKRILDLRDVKWDYKEPFVYDGTEKTVVVTGLPEEVTVSYFNNSHTEKGVYTAVAKPVYDKECYIVPDIEELRWYIL